MALHNEKCHQETTQQNDQGQKCNKSVAALNNRVTIQIKKHHVSGKFSMLEQSNMAVRSNSAISQTQPFPSHQHTASSIGRSHT